MINVKWRTPSTYKSFSVTREECSIHIAEVGRFYLPIKSVAMVGLHIIGYISTMTNVATINLHKVVCL